MASSGKKKTTMAKFARETRLRERRLNKQAKKDARKQASSEQVESQDGAPNATAAEDAQPDPEQAALDAGDASAKDSLDPGDASAKDSLDPGDASAKDSSLQRLREAPDEVLAVFEGRLRQEALAEGATEQELREAQSGHPEHG